MSERERARGVIAASAGNHAQGVALRRSHLGLRAVIVMPKTTPEIKDRGGAGDGGPEVVLHGDASYSEAKAHCDGLVPARARVRAPLRRPAGHRRPGHDRRGDPAPVPRADGRGLRAGRRGRADRRGGRLPEGGDAGDPGGRGRALRGRRDVPLARGGPARAARPGGDLRGRGRGARRGGGDVPDRAGVRGRRRARHERRDLRGDQGRLRRDAQRDGAGGSALGGGAQGLARPARGGPARGWWRSSAAPT